MYLRLTSQWASGSVNLCLCCTGITSILCHVRHLFHEFHILSSGPHFWHKSTFPAELPPQPCTWVISRSYAVTWRNYEDILNHPLVPLKVFYLMYLNPLSLAAWVEGLCAMFEHLCTSFIFQPQPSCLLFYPELSYLYNLSFRFVFSCHLKESGALGDFWVQEASVVQGLSFFCDRHLCQELQYAVMSCSWIGW